MRRRYPCSSWNYNPARMTERRRQVLRLGREGLDNRAIAARLGIAHSTVVTHWSEIYVLLGVENRADALACDPRPLPGLPQRRPEGG